MNSLTRCVIAVQEHRTQAGVMRAVKYDQKDRDAVDPQRIVDVVHPYPGQKFSELEPGSPRVEMGVKHHGKKEGGDAGDQGRHLDRQFPSHKKNQCNPRQRKENNRRQDGKIEGVHYQVLFHASYSFMIKRHRRGQAAFLSGWSISPQTTPPGKKSSATNRCTSVFCLSAASSPRSPDPR